LRDMYNRKLDHSWSSWEAASNPQHRVRSRARAEAKEREKAQLEKERAARIRYLPCTRLLLDVVDCARGSSWVDGHVDTVNAKQVPLNEVVSDAEPEQQLRPCPRHYARGQELGAHALGAEMGCGCCWETCDICIRAREAVAVPKTATPSSSSVVVEPMVEPVVTLPIFTEVDEILTLPMSDESQWLFWSR
jgi:hypothetical protein